MQRILKYKKQILMLCALVLILSLAVFFLFARSGQLGRLITYRTLGGQNHAELFQFQGQGGEDFALFGNGIALAGLSGLQVYNRAGELVYDASASLRHPVLQVNDAFVLAYDIGGFDLFIGNRHELLRHHTTEGRIIDARINENGWLTLSMEQIGRLGVIHIIDPDGNTRFEVESGTRHVITADLAANNRTLAVLFMAENATHVLWYDIRQADGQYVDPQYLFYRDDELFFDFWFTGRNGALAIISDSSILHLSQTGNRQRTYNFEGRHLRGFDTDDGRAVIYLGQGQVGTRGEIILFHANGTMQHLPVLGTLLDISLTDRFVAALFAEELVLYRNLREYARLDRLQHHQHVLARDDGSVITLAPNRAQVFVP